MHIYTEVLLFFMAACSQQRHSCGVQNYVLQEPEFLQSLQAVNSEKRGALRQKIACAPPTPTGMTLALR